MVAAAIVVFGWVSLQRTPVELMPELSYPTITLRTEYPGAAPEEVEDAVTRPIEELLGTVEGLVGMTSTSRAGSSDVVFRFDWGTQLDVATQKVRERLSLVRLPDEIEPPLILRYDPTLDPIVTLAVVGGANAASLRAYVEDEVEPALEQVEGVAMVRVMGGREAVVQVELIESRLAAFGLTAQDVVARLRADNVNVAGGQVTEGEVDYLVRTLNEVETIDELRRTAVAVREGAVVSLGDVATVRAAEREATVLTGVDGRESVQISLYKEADANLVDTASGVMDRVFGAPDGGAAARAHAGEGSGMRAGGARAGSGEDASAGEVGPLATSAADGARFEVLTDQSLYVRAAIDEVQATAVLGGVLAIVILFVFLQRGYPTFVISLAIPLSILATFAPMRLLGVTVNIMSLGGLALGIGMLVDNAVVVLESIVRCREEGDAPREAALRGTAEVAAAVVASTLTTVAVFLPITFVEGVAGQMFADLAVTVVLSLIASLAFALLFVPMMAALPARWSPADSAAPRSLRAVLAGQLSLSSLAAARADVAAARGALQGLRAAAWLVVGPYIAARTVLWFASEVVTRALAVAATGAGVAGWWTALVTARAVGSVLAVPLGAFEWVYGRFAGAYARGIRTSLRVRWVVAGFALAAFAWTLRTIPELGMQLIPELRQGVFIAEMRLPVGTSLEQSSAVAERVLERVASAPSIARVSMFIGRDDDDLESAGQGEHYVRFTVVVSPSEDVVATEDGAVAAIRSAIALQPAAELEISRPTLLSLSSPVSVVLRGEELDLLRESADRVETIVRAQPGLTDVRSSARDGFPEVRITFDRARLAALGLEVRPVADAVRAKLQGETATSLRRGDRSVDVDVAVRRSDILDLAGLEELVVAFERPATDAAAVAEAGLGGWLTGSAQGVASTGTGTGPLAPIRLGGVAHIEIARGPAEIRRVDGQRAAAVTAASSLSDLERTVAALRSALRALPPVAGQSVAVEGQAEEMAQARVGLTFAFGLAVFLVYVVMASTFESFVGPVVILLTIPLALFGVVGVLALTRTPMSVLALIGVIILVGIVVNNAIVLVDAIIAGERAGVSRADAVVRACSVRLRPVLITTTTTVLGLLPMLVEVGEGAEIRRPLAAVLVAGLSISTVLTLVVIPTAYTLMMPKVRPLGG